MQKFFLAVVIYSLVACSATPPPQFYTLDAVLQPTISSGSIASPGQRVVGIGPIALPAVLNRKAIVTRGAQQSIQVTDAQQWAEPLLENVTRVIARNIATLNPKYILHAYPWTAFGAVDTRVVIEVTQLEGQPGKAVYFEAVWSVKDEQRDRTLKQGHSKLQRPLKGQDTAEMVGQMNDILAAFSTELSAALR